jgi:hypothetical protein
VRILGNLRSGVGRIVYDNLLSGDEDSDGCLEALHIKGGIFFFELHQIQRSKIAGCIVEEDIFRARVG